MAKLKVVFSLLVISGCMALQAQQLKSPTVNEFGPNKHQIFPKSDSTTKKWQFFLEPYFMFPNMHGTTGVGNLPDADVDEDPGDIFSNLQIGAMLYAEAYTDLWAISSDITYMKLKDDVAGGTLIRSGEAEMSQFAWELAGLRRILPWLDAGLALQLNNIKADVNLVLNLPPGSQVQRSLSETWVDPSIVARAKFPLSRRISLVGRGNVGGFGIGSDFYWQLQAYAGYRISHTVLLSLGYRAISMDYQKGEGQDRFLYDMNTFGPVVRIGFNF